ncbi:MAG: type II secretion system protein GspN [Desulfobacterales bacterium]|nr:type II secretion system protein GspN [Desulfobacterales bacterium]
MINLRKGLLYTLYIIATTVFFIYYLFPSDDIKDFLTFQLNKASSDFQINIDKVTAVFPPGIQLNAVGFYHLNSALFETNQLKIIPSISSLLSSKTTWLFKGDLHQGIVKGRADITADKPTSQVTIEVDLADIAIENIPGVQNLIEHKITGKMGGKVTYDFKKTGAEMINAQLNISNCTIEILHPLLSLGNFNFKQIETDLSIEDQQIQIKECIIKGKQIDGKILGSITLSHSLDQSRLNLRGTIKPHHLFLTTLIKSIPANIFLSKRPGEEGFRFKIDGTFAKPNFSLQ